MILHTFNKPACITENLGFVAADDLIVLIEDGVYALLHNTGLADRDSVLVLDVDADARGIGKSDSAQRIGYQDLVELCARADQIKNWF